MAHVGKCELCNVKAVEVYDVSELACWPVAKCCAPCRSELLADDDDARSGEEWCDATA